MYNVSHSEKPLSFLSLKGQGRWFVTSFKNISRKKSKHVTIVVSFVSVYCETAVVCHRCLIFFTPILFKIAK